MNPESFNLYKDTFCQFIPKYAIKHPGGHWLTKNKTLSDICIQAHLRGDYATAVLGKYYPPYGLIDIDNRGYPKSLELRSMLKLNSYNSMFCDSESKDSFHILFRPYYNGKPPTLSLYKAILQPQARLLGVEVYPQQNKCIRLPFGPLQNCLDEELYHLKTADDKLYQFLKLDEVEIGNINPQQRLDFNTEKPSPVFLDMTKAEMLLAFGLQEKSTRNHSQYLILSKFYYQDNLPPDTNIKITWEWINTMHNGYSEEIITHPEEVYRQIKAQALWIYENNERRGNYPNFIHNNHYGYISKPDIEDIVKLCRGNLPRMRYWFEIIKYSYPRRHRAFIDIHSNKLIQWSSKDVYLKYIREFEEMGIFKRGTKYRVEKFSKSLKSNWKYRDPSNAIILSGRALNTFEETVLMIYTAREFRNLLMSAGCLANSADRIINYIWS